MHKTPRVRVSAMIWNYDHLLLISQGRKSSPRWMLPGGGVDPGESMTLALKRELKEEIGLVDLVVREPVALVESIAPMKHRSGRHLIHVTFRVELNSEIDTRRPPKGTDPDIYESRWVKREELLSLPLHPPIGKYLRDYRQGSDFEYFGSMWAP